MKSSKTVQISPPMKSSKTVQIHLQWRVPKQSKFTSSEEFQKQSMSTRWVGIFEMLYLLEFCSDFDEL